MRWSGGSGEEVVRWSGGGGEEKEEEEDLVEHEPHLWLGLHLGRAADRRQQLRGVQLHLRIKVKQIFHIGAIECFALFYAKMHKYALLYELFYAKMHKYAFFYALFYAILHKKVHIYALFYALFYALLYALFMR